MNRFEHRLLRQQITARARLEPNYEDAIADARQLGFGCEGYTPRNWLCRLLGRHIDVFAMRTCSSDGSWDVEANCCNIHGFYYPRRSSLPTAHLVPEVKDPPWPLWRPGDTAFWLDPKLWDRTPYRNGRLEPCWMYLK